MKPLSLSLGYSERDTSSVLRNFYIMTLASGKGDALGGGAAILAAFLATILYGIKAYKLIKAAKEPVSATPELA